LLPMRPVPPRMTIFIFLFLVSDLGFVLRYRNCVFDPCLLFAIFQLPLDPRVRNQPKERGEHVQSSGNPWTDKRE
jgi:hypothetical protein